MDRVWDERFSSGGAEDTSQPDSKGFLKGSKTRSAGPNAALFEPSEDETEDVVVRTPDPVNIAMADLRAVSRAIELELGQIATVESRGITRYLATTEDKLDFFLVSPDALQIKAAAIGTTVVHIWDSEGRTTVQIRVVPQKSIAQYIKRKEERVDRAESFKIEYTNDRSANYQGNSFRTLAQNSLAYSQGFKVAGDTPVGPLTGNAEIREIGDKPILSQISARVDDFHYGSVKDADLSLMDTNFRSPMLILPQYRFRGVQWDHHPEKQPFKYTAFYGRELTSILGTLGTASGTGSDTLDSFAGGGMIDWEMNKAASYRFGYVQAYGQNRADELNNHGYEFDQNYTITDHFGVTTHTGFDSDHFSSRIAGVWRYPNVNLRTEYRDTSKRFFTMVGNPGGQGEQGVNFDFMWNVSDAVDMRYNLDVYRDRLFYFPGEYDNFNNRQDMSVRWRITPVSSLEAEIRNYEETALISPYRDKSEALIYTHGVMMFDRRFSFFSRLANTNSTSLTSPESDFRRQTLGLGVSVPIFQDTFFTYQQNISLLDESLSGVITHPRSMVYSLSRRARVGDTPFTTDFTARYTDEEETDSQRSFMIGEDRTELSGSLTYALENMEFFLDGRYASMWGENIINESRAEGEIVTGVRYTFDTQVRWEPKARFFGNVYLDQNGDGHRQPDEAGVAGQMIRVDGQEIVTDAQGNYQTASVGGKRAVIILDPNKIPYGHTVTGSLRREVEIADAARSVDFGLVARSSVMGLVFNDLNGNQKYDPGDVGVGRVKVSVDNKEARTTDASGRYRFDELKTGSHKIQMELRTLPIGYLPVGPMRREVELTEGVQFRTDFAVTAERTVNGRVFTDANKNKHADKDEAGLAGARVRLGDLTAESDADGYYLFENVPVGTYTLTVQPGPQQGHKSDYSREIKFTEEPSRMEQDIPVQAA